MLCCWWVFVTFPCCGCVGSRIQVSLQRAQLPICITNTCVLTPIEVGLSLFECIVGCLTNKKMCPMSLAAPLGALFSRVMNLLCWNQDMEANLSGRTEYSLTVLWLVQHNGSLTLMQCIHTFSGVLTAWRKCAAQDKCGVNMCAVHLGPFVDSLLHLGGTDLIEIATQR